MMSEKVDYLTELMQTNIKNQVQIEKRTIDEIPVKTTKDLQEFNKKLENDEYFSDVVIYYLYYFYRGKMLTMYILAIFEMNLPNVFKYTFI